MPTDSESNTTTNGRRSFWGPRKVQELEPQNALKQRLPRWARISSAIAMLCVASLLAGLILGWVARGALVPDPGTEAADTGTAASDEAADAGKLPMPDVRGLSEADARQVLADAGYSQSMVTIATVPSVISAGTIAAQEPVAGTEKPVSITLSLPSPAKMPELIGKPVDEATRAITAMGAQPSLKRIYDPKAKAGTVLETDPAPGSVLNANPSLTVAGAASSVPLSSLKASGDCGTTSSGTVNGTTITDGLRCSAREKASSTHWILGRKAAQLRATVGLEDSEAKETRVSVRILADDRVVLDREFAYGESASVDADVSGALRLDVEVTKIGKAERFGSEYVLLGNAILLGSAEAMAALGATP